MATKKQREAAKKNIRKAQQKWQSMSSKARAQAQPQGRARAKPGADGTGNYYRVTVRDKNDFVTFRTHDVGEPGHIQRLAGKRSSGSWDTQAWLISKADAHVAGNRLVPDSAAAKKVLSQLSSRPIHVKGDIFTAKPRRNVPESAKPTAAQRRARRRNLAKARAAK